MKPHLDWHRTGIGRFLLFIGGLRLAIPVMALVAAAMIWGTYLDSTAGAKVAGRLVYGSGWFIALMALICLSLIAAVITRYPWNRRHIGFITVHTGLIILIIGGFWSLFGRIEGHVALQEGQSSNEIEMDLQRLELLRPGASGSGMVASHSAEDHVSGLIVLDGVKIEIVDRWANISREPWVADDAPTPLRAFEIAFDDTSTKGMWIGESAKSGGPAFADGMTIRVLGEGEAWTLPEPAGGKPEGGGYMFIVNGQQHPLGSEGDEVFPGWTITSVQRFNSAVVTASGLRENESGGSNPAVDVIISNGDGTAERHTAFEKFPDMVLKRTLEGTADSHAEMHSGGTGGEKLVLFGSPSALRAGFIPASGEADLFEHDAALPWTIRAGGHIVTILDQRTHARQATRFVEAPAASDYRPALVVRMNGAEPKPLAWKSSLNVPGSDATVRYGPRRVILPFSLRLDEFRKKDYPGTTIAMAYESDVVVDSPRHDGERVTIHMNHPYRYDDWKVYQSGFRGDSVSIFSVMKDPGLITTYTGCVILCIGILVTFYFRAFSRGHPGIGRANQPKGAIP